MGSHYVSNWYSAGSDAAKRVGNKGVKKDESIVN